MLSRLNRVAVRESLFVSESEEVCLCSLNSPLVMKGPSWPTQIHLKSVETGGNQGGLVEKVESGTGLKGFCH